MHRSTLLAALIAAPLPSASAGTSTASMTINSSVIPLCVVSATTLDFGTYDPVSANAASPLDGTGTITLQCIRNTAYTVTLDQGLNGTATTRNLKESGGTLLSYELYSDAGRTTVWNTTNTVAGTAASRAPISYTVYGRIPPAQDVVPASYSDTVAITVNF